MRIFEITSNRLIENIIPSVYHGTDKKFNNFSLGMPTSSGVSSSGIFFTKSRSVAQGYGSNVITVDLYIEDGVTFDFNSKSTIHFDGKNRSPSDLVNRISEINDDLHNGYGLPEDSDLVYDLEDAGWDESSGLDYIDGIILKNVDDSMTAFGGDVTDHYVVFSSNQIKIRK